MQKGSNVSVIESRTVDYEMPSAERKYLVILNPASRSGRAAALANTVDNLFSHILSPVALEITKGPGHARVLAAKYAADYDVIIVMGGDGTVHEVGTGLLSVPAGAAMAVLPVGTGNDFARMLGMNSELKSAALQLCGASFINSDVGLINFSDSTGRHESHFINAVGIGFDGYAASIAPRFKHLPFNSGYLITVLRALANWQAVPAEIRDDVLSDTVRTQLFMMTVGNAMDSGGGFRINPKASIVDGVLDVCLVSHVSILRALRLLPSAAKGQHLDFPEVQYWHSRNLTVNTESPVPIHADGEILSLDAMKFEIRNIPGALRLFVPDPSIL